MNQFNFIKSADAFVRQQLSIWNEFIRGYLREEFGDNLESVRGTNFSDCIAKVAYINELIFTVPDSFRGVIDARGSLQAGAIVQVDVDCLLVEAFSNVPWNIVTAQPESLKGSATSLMEELVKES